MRYRPGIGASRESRSATEASLTASLHLPRRRRSGCSNDLGIDPGNTLGADREAAKQLIEENFEAYVAQDELFHELIQDVLDRVRERFDQINHGILERHRSGWPKRWTFETDDRDKFIAQIRWFSSNDWRQFGRLLTPLVDGIRVRGPLFPPFTETAPQLVLIDGQGLGHTPDSSSSVTTHITGRFDRVNVISVGGQCAAADAGGTPFCSSYGCP